MKSYVITIFGLEHSEAGAARCIRSGKAYGFPVHYFSAVNRYRAEAEMESLGLFLNPNFYSKVSDKEIGDRGKVAKGDWELTRSELGCFLSHYKLWEKSVRLKENIIIFEHDAEIVAHIPRLPEGFIAANFDTMRFPRTLGYTITPEAAQYAIDEARSHGVQPSDELLWRSALKDKPIFKPELPIIKLRDGGVSTIQWNRSDTLHAHQKKEDPWLKFQGLGRSQSKAHEQKHSGKEKAGGIKKTITLPIYNRPYYLVRTLNSLSKLDTSDYTLFVNAEPNSEASLDLIKQIDFMDVDLKINEEKLGVRKNPFDLIDRAFKEGSEWNFHIEDDLIFSPDAMDLVNWYFDHQQEDVLIYGTCNRQKLSNNVLDTDIYINPINFSGLGWCINKDNWLNHIRDIWFDPSPIGLITEEGWDWSIVRYLRYGKYSEMLPILSRTTTIGEFGTYSNRETHSTFRDMKISKSKNSTFRLLK